MKWRTCKLGDVIILKRGHDLPGDTREEGDVPVVSSSGITGFHNQAKAEPPGVVTGRYGTIGEVFYIEQQFWPLNTALYVIDFKGTDPKFAAYFLKDVLKDYQSDKAAVPGVNRNVLHAFDVRVPDVDAQKRIASILSAYDDLIENNRRRMALLEESARLLYREWFVRLRFPSHEHTRLVNGTPAGWRKVALGDICTDSREIVSPDALEPDTPYIGLEHMPRRSISLTEWGTAEQITSSKLRFVTGDILFGKIRPYFHKVGIAFTDGVVSSDAFVIRPKTDDLKSFVLMIVSSDQFVADTSQAMREGSKMPRADWKQMVRYSVLTPPAGLLEDFTETITAITDQLRNLCFQNQKLRTARDLLLPKLMSGEILI
jgi:type I restriction enzyme S subunit